MLSRLAAAILSCSLSFATVAHAEAMRAPVPEQQALSSTAVRAALAARREHNIAAFRAYASAGIPSALKPGWRAQADATLAASYRETEQFLADHATAGLDDATERLMADPALARQLLDGRI